MIPNTEVWLTTEASLGDLCHSLRLTDVCFDAEDYWEWVIGDLDGTSVDVTRTHTRPQSKTLTRIFRVDRKAFEPSEIATIIDRLKEMAFGSQICWGAWAFKLGHDFEILENGRSA